MYLAPLNADNIDQMNVKKIVLLLVVMGILGSCSNDDNDPDVEVVPPRLLADQTIEDDAAIKEYLETHFYNYEDFTAPPDSFDFKIILDTIAEENADKIALIDQVMSETIRVSSTEFGLATEENDVQHTLY